MPNEVISAKVLQLLHLGKGLQRNTTREGQKPPLSSGENVAKVKKLKVLFALAF